jgi:ElaB/YqjD/DUF883 family membrane-anchored ribosome-binding protein
MASQVTKAVRMLERTADDVQTALDRVKRALPNGELVDTTSEGLADALRNAAQKLVEATRAQTSELANAAYVRGERAAKTVRAEVRENWIDLTIGGVVGLCVGYLLARQMNHR